MRRLIYLLATLLFVTSCENEKMKSHGNIYVGKEIKSLENINKEDLGRVEGLRCNDSLLLVYDYQGGQSFSLFDIKTGERIIRFGAIGHGNKEIPLGSAGDFCKDGFIAHEYSEKVLALYELSVKRKSAKCDKFFRYDIPMGAFSRVIGVSDSTYIAMGVYDDRYQYTLFDEKNNVLDYKIDIYNADDDRFNNFHKHISNQGEFARHPSKDMFVGAIRFSSNIDFISIDNNKIAVVRSLRKGNPQTKPVIKGIMNMVEPTNETIKGFLDLTANDMFVFALYSDELFNQNPSYGSSNVMVYDWDGNELGMITLSSEASYITANNKALYTVEKDEESGAHIIKAYDISFLSSGI